MAATAAASSVTLASKFTPSPQRPPPSAVGQASAGMDSNLLLVSCRVRTLFFRIMSHVPRLKLFVFAGKWSTFVACKRLFHLILRPMQK